MKEFHPRAYLRSIRNVARGLQTRSEILRILERGPAAPGEIRRESSLGRSTVARHLRLLRRESIARPLPGRPRRWAATGYGQRSLGERP